MRRRRSRLRYLIPALIVGGILYATRWPFGHDDGPKPGSITTIESAAGTAYEGLGSDFRARVPLGEFSPMFRRMAEAEGGGADLRVRTARATDATGPERPAARFRVEYPADKATAEYHFARVEGTWELQSLRFVRGTWTDEAPAPAPTPPPPQPKPPVGGKVAEGVGPDPAPQPQPAAGATDSRFPCDYVVQAGDTLGSISRHFYGTARYWQQLLEANPGLSERRLRIGRKIRIPTPPGPIATPGEAETAATQ